jgi:hypothetical protein
MPPKKQLSHEEIDEKRRQRNIAKRLMLDKLRMYLGVCAPFLLTLMVIALIWSAQVLEESKLAVVTGLISTISIGLLNILNGISVPQPEDPMAASQAKLIDMIKETLEKGSTEVRVDKNMVSIGKDGASQVIASSEKDLVSGLSDSQRLEVLNMINKIEKGKK